MKKIILLYSVLFVFSTILVFTSSYTDGLRIENENELQSAFPHEVGFPISFVTLDYPRIDPPLPYTYRGNCCSRYYSWNTYWLSVILTFTTLILVLMIIAYMKRKKL